MNTQVKEEIQELSAKYLGSANRALTLIKKGTTVPVLTEDGKPQFILDKNGKPTKSLKLENKRYSEQEMLEKLRELDKKAKEQELIKEVTKGAQGSVK
jgi:hypothetical protein